MTFDSNKLIVVSIAIASVFLWAGCKDNDATQPGTATLAGAWTRSFNGGTVTINLRANGSYTVDMPGGSDAEVRGSYTVDSDRLTLIDEGGNNASTAGEAVYRFVVDGKQLTLTPISEPDENRRSVAAATWTRA